MKYFWVPSVTLVLDEPMKIEEEPYSVSHYTRSYYVAAECAEQGVSLLEESARSEQATILTLEPLQEVSLNRVPIKGRAHVPGAGVIWRSGRVFFPAS